MFLASLSVAELLLLLIYLPLELTKDQLTQQFRGGAVCKVRSLTVDSLAGVDITGFVLTGQGVHQDVDSARIRHQPGGGQPGEVSSGVPYNIIIILS